MIPGLLREILSWAVPPVVGAIIGWVTNDIAIRMLFRPLKKVSVFGVSLPFTPGIFPKERRTLARSIGRMVSRELITEEALRRQVHSPKALEALAKSVSSLSARILDAPLASLSAAGASLLAGSLQDLLREVLAGFFSSRTLIYVVRDVVGRAVASLSARKLRELLAGFDLQSFVKGRLLPLLAGEQARGAIGKAAVNALGEQAGAMITDELLASLAHAVQPLVPAAVDRLGAWLRSAGMKREMEERGRELLSRILEKLNLVQRFLLSAGQFDRRLEEKMPEIVEETIASLEKVARDPARQEAVLEAIVQAARDWRSSLGAPGPQPPRPRGEAGERLAGVLAELIDRFLAGLSQEQAREKVWAALEGAFTGGGDPSVGSFALRTLGLREEEIVEYLSSRILGYLSRPETAGLVSRELAGLAGRFLEDHGATPLAALLRIDAEKKRKLDAFLLARTVELIDEKLPEVLAGVDVEQLVVEKIDGLEVRDVERLLLQVIASHLKWINVFGAILGFLIGLLQDVLRLLRLG